MQSRQDRWTLMLEHDLNVPEYVENPSALYGRELVIFLKEKFYGCPHLTFLAKKEGVIREYDEEALRDAFQKSIILEQSGHTVWIAEGIDFEYTGTIWIRDNGSGKIRYRIREYWKRFAFSDCESVAELRDKIIIRRVANFAKKMKFKAVIVDFGWATSFVGKRGERIVFTDFRESESFD